MINRLLIVLLILLMLPFTSFAQDSEDYTCDDGENDVLNLAQAAFDDGEFETALELATLAESLCANDFQRFRAASSLKGDAQIEVNRLVFEAIQPGRVDLGDYELFMACEGEATDDYPTVIFEHGLGDNYANWADVQPAIAETTLACAYDRLGMGHSSDMPNDDTRTTAQQVADLLMLLEIAEIDPPYILVGHSIAGLNLTAYFQAYPEEVVGLVFVDASVPNQLERLETVDPIILEELDWALNTPEQFDWLASDAEFTEEADFGDLPVVVLRRGRDEGWSLADVWIELQEEQAARSTNSQLIVAENSRHYIHLDEPEVVIDAIRWVLENVDMSETDE